MKFAILTMIATALAAQGFGVVTIRSGSEYQYQGLTVSDSKVVVGNSGKQIAFVLNDDGSLGDSNSNKYLNINDGNFVLSSSPQKGFAIKDSHLVYNSGDSFIVCPSDKTVEFNGKCNGGLGVALRVVSQTTVNTFNPSGSVTPSSTAQKPSVSQSSTQKPTSTVSAKATSLVSTKPTTLVSSTVTSSTKASPQSTQGASVITPGKKFHLVAINSGSKFQYAAIKKVDSHPHVFSVGGNEGQDLTLSFQDDKTSLVDLTGRGINLDSNTGELGNVAPFGRAPATPGFSIVDGDLAFGGKQAWKACPSGGDKYSLANNDCTGGTGIALKLVYV